MIMFTFEKTEIIAVTARNLCPRPLWEQIPRIRQAGIRRVVYSDEYRLTDGVDLLRKAGIEVEKVEI